MTESTDPMKFDANTFSRGWLSVALAKSGDDARPILTGMLIEVYPLGVQLVATDSYMLFRSWVPTLGEDTPAPALDEAPTSVVIALDHYGRAEGLMRHLLKLTSGKDALPVEILVSVGPDPREQAEESFPGTEASFLIFDLPGSEILTLRLHEGEYPEWRGLVAGFKSVKTEEIAFMPDVVVARLGKLGKLHPEKALSWRFGGPEKAAAVELQFAYPSLSGLVMPTRIYLPNLAPADEQVQSVAEAVVDAVNAGALGPDVTASTSSGRSRKGTK